MYRTIILFSLFFSAYSFQCKGNQVVVTGSIESNPSKEIDISGFRIRSIHDIGKKYSATVDSSGMFSFKIPINQTEVSRLEVGIGTDLMVLQRVYLSPGDSVHIEIKGQELKFSGKGQSVLASRLYTALDSAGLLDVNYSRALNQRLVKPEDFLVSIQDFRQRRYDFLESDARFKQLNSLFAKLFKDQVEIEFRSLVNTLIGYNFYNDLPLAPKLIEYLQVSNYTNDSLTDNPEYIDLFGYYIWYGKQREIKKNNAIVDQDMRLQIAYKDSLQGKTRDIVMADRICSGLSQNKYTKLDSMLINAFHKVATDKNAITSVKRSLFEYDRKTKMIGKPLHAAIAQTRLADTSNIELSFGEMLSRYKGNVVYLEIWSLGCGPCRTTMPQSRQMEKELSDLPVKFVYITNDMYTQNLWKDVFTVSGTQENHYRSIDGSSSSMNKFMNCTLVPWYLLFDKQGHLVSFNASDPDEIQDELVELSKK
jgi:thiol-disulfide isomerase/thioredoxin